MADEEKDQAKDAEEQGGKKGGGIMAMLPLIMALVGMPIIAYAVTQFLLVPKLTSALGHGEAGGDHGEDVDDGHGGGGDGHGGGGDGHGGSKAGSMKGKVKFDKLVTNLNDSRGEKLLFTSFTAAGNSSKFTTLAEENKDQLTDLALSILGSKGIRDLEKPEARNILRAELMSQFNAALGNGMVQEIYITELAVQ